MNIKIPERFCNKMGEDFLTECKSVFSKYENFATAEMYFFPEYTDHSYKHIQYVLNTADKLIPENTMKILSPCDIFVLCLSILFHDLGMHINFYSLITLYKQNTQDKLIGTNMKNLWENFIKENYKEDTELFDISNISQDTFIKYKDKVANFVREQHPFIAQVIADFGFPDKTGFIEYKEKGKPFYYELSGYIARSHGLDLRNIIEYLKKIYGDLWKTPYGCFVIYLMCIVRIADYLHITDDRINKYRLNLQNFNSQISKEEYLKHKSVYHSQTIYDNPETVYVEVNVDNCNIYLGMLDLLESIQRELDSSWAILGEVYGKSDLEMSIRRITSNILSEDWQNKSKFVPEQFSFHYDTNLMDLLIEPLYGNNASYAVRELIQNATDACKTRKAVEGNKYIPKVEISIMDDCFVIADNGIGMTLNVIKNHFLNIGSSFRTSEEYKKVVSSTNNSIQRNGKFGIGILSSFLLGNTITVSTKSKEEIEYIFSTKKDTKVIEIEKRINNNSRYAGDSPYGTQIIIKLYSEIVPKELIIEDWYKINDININILNRPESNSDQNLINVDELKCEDGIWHELLGAKDYGFQKVYWSYEYKIKPIRFSGKKGEKSPILSPNLICNGILIPDSYSKRIESKFIENWPTVLIFDADGKLDLNLSRDEINGNLPFTKELEKELMREFAEIFIDLAQQQNLTKKQLAFDGHNLRYSKLKMQNYLPQKIVYTKKGYSLYNKYFMCSIRLNKVIRIWTYKKREISLFDIEKYDVGYILEGEGRHPNLKNEITGYRNYNFDTIFWGGTIYLHRADFEDYKNYAANLYRLSRKFIDGANIKYLEETKKDAFGLNINFEDISLIIEYDGKNINNIISLSSSESDNILSYFDGKAIFSYKKDVSE